MKIIKAAMVIILFSCAYACQRYPPGTRPISEIPTRQLIQSLYVSEDENAEWDLDAVKELIDRGPESIDVWIDTRDAVKLLWGEYIIRGIGEPALDPLLNGLRTADDEYIKNDVITALGWFGESASEAIDLLLAELESENKYTVIYSLQTLQSINYSSSIVYDRIIPLLNDDDYQIVTEAVFTLGSLAQEGDEQLLNSLNSHLQKEPNVIITIAAEYARYNLGWHKQEMFESISNQALNDNSVGQIMAIRSLSSIHNQQSLEILKSIIYEVPHDHSSRTSIIRYLPETGPSQQVIEILTEAISDEDCGLQFLAITRLGRFGPAANSALPVLHSLKEEGRVLCDENRDAMDSAILFIEQGPELYGYAGPR